MRIYWFRGWIPILLIRVWDVPFGWGKMQCWGPVIWIHRSRWVDTALLNHELQHVEDALRRFGILYLFRYIFSLSFRRRMEARGYAAQAKSYVENRGYSREYAVYLCATWLSNREDLRWPYEEAREMLLRELGWEDSDDVDFAMSVEMVVAAMVADDLSLED